MWRVNIILLGLIFLSSSFDIFLNVKLGGFSFRFSYFVLLLFLLFNAYLLFEKKLKIRFLGLLPFLIWTAMLVAFVFNTTLLSRNLGYLLWHFLHLLLILFLPNVIDSKERLAKAIRWYIYSFFMLGCFGLMQFFLGLVGISLYVTQWWLNDLFPRVNGLSYEPSYYATYMLIGWSLMFSLLIRNVQLFTLRRTIFLFVVITIAMFASTSRMGIFFMALQASAYFLILSAKSFLTLRINRRLVGYLFAFLMTLLLTVAVVVPKLLDQYQFLLSGTGVAGQSAHSAERFTIMQDLWNVFLQQPLIGKSLGGIPSAIAKEHGVAIHTVEEAKQFEGINIFLEVLVASGLIGFAFFIIYFINLFQAGLRLSRRISDTYANYRGLLSALLITLLMELLILSLNQNILRLYLWLHIALVNSAYYCLTKITKSPQPKKLV